MPGFDISQRPMRLSVPGQVTGRAVTFSTIRTLTFLIVGCLLRRLLCSYCIMVVVVNIVFLDVLFIGIRTVNDRSRVLFEVDDTDFGQLRQIVQLVSDRRLLSVDDMFIGV